MQLTEESANRLCRRVVASSRRRVVDCLVAWPLLPTVLQVGGIETRAASRILAAIEQWLFNDENRPDLHVMPEYRLSKSLPPDEITDSDVRRAIDQIVHRRIDYAVVHGRSIGQASLAVETVIEVKTNYLCQSDLKVRPLNACHQANSYGEICGAPAYVLYIVASPVGVAPQGARDPGWQYFRVARQEVYEVGPIAVEGVRVIGQYPAGSIGHAVETAVCSIQLWACVLTAP